MKPVAPVKPVTPSEPVPPVFPAPTTVQHWLEGHLMDSHTAFEVRNNTVCYREWSSNKCDILYSVVKSTCGSRCACISGESSGSGSASGPCMHADLFSKLSTALDEPLTFGWETGNYHTSCPINCVA